MLAGLLRLKRSDERSWKKKGKVGLNRRKRLGGKQNFKDSNWHWQKARGSLEGDSFEVDRLNLEVDRLNSRQ